MIKKIFTKHSNNYNERVIYYMVSYSFKNNMRIFKDFRELTYEDTEYISLFNFNSEEFLKENNIEYIKDVRGEIIPIGIVDFSKNNLYKKLDYLNLIVNSKEDLYKCNSILRNIDEAIRIKYEEVKFIERFADNWEEVSEEIEL